MVQGGSKNRSIGIYLHFQVTGNRTENTNNPFKVNYIADRKGYEAEPKVGARTWLGSERC